MKKANKNILITGGAGYIGTTLTPKLLQQGYKVKVFDNLSMGGSGLMSYFSNPNFEFIKADIRDTKALKKAVEGMDAVIHLAAIVGYPACRKDPKTSREINVTGTQNLVKSLKPKQQLMFASTGSAYGKMIAQYCTETTPLRPLSDYGKQKAQAEKIVGQHKNSIIYRFATAFGVSPRLRLDLLINDFAYRAVKEKTIIVYEKEFMRTFIDVKDIARAFIHGLENFSKMRNEVYNVGDESMNFSKEGVAKELLKLTDYYLHFADAGKDIDQRNYIVDYSKIRSTGFRCQVSLKQGLSELIKAMQIIEIKNPYSNV
jgi:nucleoside-diphosphate-sugar epimerase